MAKLIRKISVGKKNKDVLPWKDFNKNMAVSVEYNLEY